MSAFPGRRRSGLLLPLFSCPSSTSWGIGDIGDIAPLCGWLAGAGQRVLQLLPLNEMASGQQSPYSAMSAMAIDPIYISVPRIPECAETGDNEMLALDDLAELDEARRAPRVTYGPVRRLKQKALRGAFERFCRTEWQTDSPRARNFAAFLAAQSWWIEDYALFRALYDREHQRGCTEWHEGLRTREPNALDYARTEL